MRRCGRHPAFSPRGAVKQQRLTKRVQYNKKIQSSQINRMDKSLTSVRVLAEACPIKWALDLNGQEYPFKTPSLID